MLAQSLRQLRRAPGFVLFAVVILGLGIGANASIFSVLNALLLQPLPYPDGDKIVRALNRSQRFGLGQNVSGPNYKDWHDQSNSFAAFARYRGGEVALSVRDRAQFQPVYLVSEEFFSVFGLVPVAGQLPEAREYRENHAESAVISHAFWQSEFGASPTSIGQTVKFDNRLYRISAIAPPGFQFPTQAAVWVFDTPDGDRLNRTANNFRIVGRIKPGITLGQAQSEMDAIAAGLAQKYPNENKDRGVTLLPVAEEQARPYRQTLELLFAATLLLLLIACANVSSLLLARAIARQREFAVRASLGATAYHVLGQLLTESALLGLGACLAALLFAYGITRGLIQLLPPGFPRAQEISVDFTVFGFAALLALLASTLCALYPAWQVSRTDILPALKLAGQKGSLGGSSGPFRRSLATLQIALSLTLLCGALLLARSMANLLGVNLGLDPSNVLVSYLHVPAQSLEDHRRAGQTVEQMIAEVRSQPGVVSAAAIMGMPTGKYGSNGAYIRAGEMSMAEMNRAPNAGFRVNSPQFFATMKIPLLQGREFTPNDTADSPPVAIVNQALVKLTFPKEDPIGKQLICGLDSIKPMTIVGVVGDVRHAGPATPPGPEIYMPLAQHPFYANEVQLAIRAQRDPRPLAETMRALAARHNPDIAVNSLLLQTMVEDSVSSSRFRSLLLLTLSAIALTLAAAGVYGVLAYLVNLRLSEFGLRRALGASAGSILKLVAREAGLLLAIGTVLGLTLTLALEQYLRSFLFGISPRDVSTIAYAVFSLAAMALLAAAAPALAAARVDPMRVLRSE